jgi:hypothetical protein
VQFAQRRALSKAARGLAAYPAFRSGHRDMQLGKFLKKNGVASLNDLIEGDLGKKD